MYLPKKPFLSACPVILRDNTIIYMLKSSYKREDVFSKHLYKQIKKQKLTVLTSGHPPRVIPVACD